MQRTLTVTCATAAAFVFNGANAHGYISKPAADFIDPSILTKYVKTITASVNTAFEGLKWNDSPEANTATFASSFPKTGYSSLRDMLDKQVPNCGNTRTDIPPVDVAGLTVMNWQNNEAHKGFIDSHHGPCEVWIDDTLVDCHDDCVAFYGSGYPANVNADFSKCSGTCTLRFYWLALHEPNWQIYKQCVPVKNNKAGTLKQETAVPTDTVPPAGSEIPATAVNPTDTATTNYSPVTANITDTANPTATANFTDNKGPSNTVNFSNIGNSTDTVLSAGTVIPADTTSDSGNKSSLKCHTSVRGRVNDTSTHSTNDNDKVNRTNSYVRQ